MAPGVSIFSTFPEYVNSQEEGIDYSSAYSRISGTSMASPHVAGVVALMLQNNPELSAADAKVALMNNGDVITPDKDNDSANGNGQGTGDDSINKNDNGSTNKPDKNKGNKMPITGGTAALPVIVGAMALIGAGIKIRKRK